MEYKPISSCREMKRETKTTQKRSRHASSLIVILERRRNAICYRRNNVMLKASWSFQTVLGHSTLFLGFRIGAREVWRLPACMLFCFFYTRKGHSVPISARGLLHLDPLIRLLSYPAVITVKHFPHPTRIYHSPLPVSSPQPLFRDILKSVLSSRSTSNSPRMVDLFSSLPVELRLDIFKNLTDLQSLYNLICGSSSAKETFEHHPIQIAGSIISGLKLEMRQLMCAACLSKAGFSLNSFIDGDLYTNHEKFTQSYVDEKSGNPLPSDTPLSAVRSMIGSSLVVNSIAQHFLDTYIDQLNSIEAEHPIPPNFHFVRGSIFSKYPEGRSYACQRTGPASWVESYRVLRALWRIQMLMASGSSASSASLTQDMIVPEEKNLTQLTCAQVWSGLTNWEIEETKCVMEFLDERKDLKAAMTMQAMMNDETSMCARDLLSHSFVTSEVKLQLYQPALNETTWLWGQDESMVTRPSRAYRWFHAFSGRTNESPIEGIEWSTFRRLGFGIWDCKRMCTLELMSSPTYVDPNHPLSQYTAGIGVQMLPANTAFTWRSIRVNGRYIAKQVRNGKCP